MFAGVASALQSRSNGELTQHSGNGVNSALFSFIIGLLILSVIAVSSRGIRAAIARIPGTVCDGTLVWWAVPAGVLGGVFIACASFAVAIVGVAMFAVGAVVGQTATALLVDRLGVGPNGRSALTSARVISAVIAVFAVVIAASGSINAEGFSLAAILAALGAPPSSPGADQWFVLAASLAGPCASLVEPLAGERPAKDGEEAGAVAELKR